MKTLYIHIGLPKTGTSYLQSCFAYNHKIYRKKGLVYPDLCNNNLHASEGKTSSGNGLHFAASGIPFLIKRGIPNFNSIQLLNKLESSKNHLISSEWLSHCPISFFENLEHHIEKKFELKYIACVRNPTDHASSLYLQGLKVGGFKSPHLEKHIEHIVSEIQKCWSLIHQLSSKLIIINYDIHKHNLISQFDDIFFQKNLSKEPTLGHVNPSPNRHESEILKLASQLGISDFHSSMTYLEENRAHIPSNTQEKFLFPSHLQSLIKVQLKGYVDRVNLLLPNDQQVNLESIIKNKSEHKPIFQQEDIQFLTKLIKKKQRELRKEDLQFTLKCLQKDFSNEAKLPKDFEVAKYLLHNPDIIQARVDPIKHYLKYGIKENRRYQ